MKIYTNICKYIQIYANTFNELFMDIDILLIKLMI